eukprot:3694745-Amphidinium_carterae.1
MPLVFWYYAVVQFRVLTPPLHMVHTEVMPSTPRDHAHWHTSHGSGAFRAACLSLVPEVRLSVNGHSLLSECTIAT